MRLCIGPSQVAFENMFHQDYAATWRIGFFAEHLVGKGMEAARACLQALAALRLADDDS